MEFSSNGQLVDVVGIVLVEEVVFHETIDFVMLNRKAISHTIVYGAA